MLEVSKIEVWGWAHTIRGARNAMNSWDKSDTKIEEVVCDKSEKDGVVCERIKLETKVGPVDLDLMHRLYVASLDNNFAHRKFLRQLSVAMDVNAPLYWWKEYDTYKVGTVANSCSTMHKIHAKEFVVDDFSHEHLLPRGLEQLEKDIAELNYWRDIYLNGGTDIVVGYKTVSGNGPVLETFKPKDKRAWWQMIQSLPTTFNQKRTLTFNYEVAITIIKQRTGHKLDEWHTFVDALQALPHLQEIVHGVNADDEDAD